VVTNPKEVIKALPLLGDTNHCPPVGRPFVEMTAEAKEYFTELIDSDS
jgi:hypothetical protein